MTQTTLQGPSHQRMLPNTVDETAEGGWSFRRIIFSLNVMFADLYDQAGETGNAITLIGPDKDHRLPNTVDETPENGWSYKRIIDSMNIMFGELYTIQGGGAQQVTLQGPASHRMLPNTADETPERGWTFKHAIDAINLMMTEIYAAGFGLHMTSDATVSVAENATLSFTLTASEASTFAITGGVDAARMEISTSTLRWASNGMKNYEAPNDDNTNNTYVIQVTPTNLALDVGTPQTITVTVTQVNEAPTVANVIPNQSATEDVLFSFQFASNTFADVDAGDTKTYTATKSDNSALPAWLTFTPATRTFSGTPAGANVGTLSVKVTVTDSGALTVSDTFDIVVDAASAPGAPEAPIIDLLSTSDSGSSSTDNITNDTTPDFNVTMPDGLVAGNEIHVYNTGVEVSGSPHTITSGEIANLAATVTMTIASPCVVTWPGDLPSANTSVTFTTTGALPTGLVAGTTYFVKSPSGSTSNLSATAGGSAINTSGSQSGVHTAKVAIRLGLSALSQGAGQDITMKVDDGTLSAASNIETLTIDTSAPTLSSSTPTDNATSVAVNTNIALTFNETIVAGATASFTIKKTSDNSTVQAFTEADFGGALTISGAVLTINPTDLAGSTEFYLVWTAGSVTDVAGNAVAAQASTTALSFTTVGDVVAPTISTLSPADNATGVAITANLVATFSESVQFHSTVSISLFKFDDTLVEAFDETDIGTLISISGAALTINPTASLLNSQAYYVQITSGSIKDLAGNSFTGITDETTWSFTTVAAAADVAFDAASHSSVDNNTVLSWTHTPSGTPSGVIVTADWFDGSTAISAATYGGNAMTSEGSATYGSIKLAIYSLPNPPSGAQTVSLTFASAIFGSAGAVTVTGSDTADAVRNSSFASATGTSNTPTVNVTSQSGDLVIDVVHHEDQSVAWVPDAGPPVQTERWADTAGAVDGRTSSEPGDTSVTMSWTANTVNDWGIAAVSVKKA